MIALIIVSVSQKLPLLCRPRHGERPPSFAVLSHDTRVPSLLLDTSVTLMSREKKKKKSYSYFWRELSKARSFLTKKQMSAELCPLLNTFTETHTVCVNLRPHPLLFAVVKLISTGTPHGSCRRSSATSTPNPGKAQVSPGSAES